MSRQLLAFALPKPPVEAGIDLLRCGVEDVLREARGARLVIADPPWRYEREAGRANPETYSIYAGLSELAIARHLDFAFDCAAPAARLAVWYTFPKLAEWAAAGWAGPRWGPVVSGGAWVKTGQVGVGYHWRGQSEPVAVFTRGATGRPSELLPNAHVSVPDEHSAKPIAWMRSWIRAWTQPGDLVLDLYAGLGTVACACKAEGRRYIGAEIDPERHEQALHRVAQQRTDHD